MLLDVITGLQKNVGRIFCETAYFGQGAKKQESVS
jgi:hypothetical protein